MPHGLLNPAAANAAPAVGPAGPSLGGAPGAPPLGGAPGGPPGPEPEIGGEPGGNASPEEQEMYDEFVSQGMNLIFDDAVQPAIQQALAADRNAPEGSPPNGLAEAAALVVVRLKEAGSKIPNNVMTAGAVEILEIIANDSPKLGGREYSQEELNTAATMAVEKYWARAKTPEDEEEAKREFDGMMQADKDGAMAQEFPGLAQKYGGATNA